VDSGAAKTPLGLDQVNVLLFIIPVNESKALKRDLLGTASWIVPKT
jgi:hypothetical protein